MLVTSISLDTATATDLPASPGAAAGTPPGGPGDSFASQLSQALDGLPQGQDLAAGGLALKTLPLGPSLELVTAGGPQPDAASLAAFAAAQGLDPEVVAWLFSEGGGKAEGSGEAKDGAAPTGDAALAAGFMPIPSLLMPGLAPAAMPAAPALAADAAAGSVTADAAAAAAATAAGASGVPGALPAGGPGTGATLAALGLGTSAWLAPLTPQAAGAGAAAQPTPAEAAEAAALAAVQGLPNARMALAQAGPAARNEALARTATDEVPVEILSLEVDPEVQALLDDPQALAAARSENAANPGMPGGSAGGTATAAADKAQAGTATGGLQQRAEGLQALAQRLGEAVGQRVLGQLARGNWSMKLMLKPATLGDVEVDLRMRAGELDASFRVTNPVARELMNDGLPRLREVLSGAGMDIAGLHVGLGSSQSHGGNPTPQQALGDAGRAARGGDDIIQAGPASVPVARRLAEGVNWDVLV